MSWNFRVILKNESKDYLDDSIITYGIHEVYYDENNDIVSISENPVPVFEETFQELKDSIERIKFCLEKPIIDYNTGEEI